MDDKSVNILATEIIHADFIKLVKHKLKFKKFNGDWSNVVQRYAIQRQNAVAVLLYNPELDTVILIEQMRVGALAEPEPWLLEPVAGLIEPPDTPEQTAIREAKEEANCDVLELEYICRYLLSAGISNEQCHLYCGRIAIASVEKGGEYAGVAAEDEDIKVHKLKSQQAFELLEKGSLMTAISIVALQWLKLNLARLRSKWLKSRID